MIGVSIFCGFQPYIEKRDNLLSILGLVQIFIVMLIAFVMKHQKEGGDGNEGDDTATFDDKYLGYVLISLNVLFVSVFLLSGIVSRFVKRSKRREVGGETLGEGEGRERGSTGVYDVFSGLRISFVDLIGWNKETPLTLDDGQNGIELGNVYSGGDDGIVDSNNPMHDVVVKRPSAVPYPPLDWDGYEKKEFKGAKKHKLKELEDWSKYLRYVSGSAKGAETTEVDNL